jgi:hypothetical protein
LFANHGKLNYNLLLANCGAFITTNSETCYTISIRVLSLASKTKTSKKKKKKKKKKMKKKMKKKKRRSSDCECISAGEFLISIDLGVEQL